LLGLSLIGAFTDNSPTEIRPVAAPRTDVSAPAAAPTPSSSPAAIQPSAAPTPTRTTKLIAQLRTLPFAQRTVNDNSLTKGTTRVRTPGRTGVERITWRVTYLNGKQVSRTLSGRVIVRKPTTKVTAVGTRAAPRCDPHYSGACVPIASDVDCSGGSGNGPAYVTGPVRVIGDDIYDLDRDGDGIACDT